MVLQNAPTRSMPAQFFHVCDHLAKTLISDINATFCDWNSWEFDSEGNCTADITSSAASFGANEYKIAMYAGTPHTLGSYSGV